MTMKATEIRENIEKLVITSSDGAISLADLQSVDGSLERAGYSSLNYMTVLSGLEQNFGITIDPFEEPTFLETVDTITDFVCEQLEIAL